MGTFNFVFVDETIKSQESKDDAEESIKEICDICGKQFNARKNLMQHKLIHTTDTTNCDICNKNFANKIKLQKHIDYVHSEKMFSCMECKNFFSSKQNLETHH